MQRFSSTLAAFFFALIFATSCAITSFAQQPEPPKAAAAPKKPAPGQTAEKPSESAIKPEAAAEPRPAQREAAPDNKDKDKEEHYDMTEVAPAVSHHQITVDGKLLKYSATAGRLPIKRGDGKIEAEMFYVARKSTRLNSSHLGI